MAETTVTEPNKPTQVDTTTPTPSQTTPTTEPKDTTSTVSPPTKSTSTEDILKRASTIKDTPQSDPLEKPKVSLDDIKDPVAREFAERRVKELESGFNKKYEDIANKRKELETKLADSSQPWTPQRIQSLLKDQTFLSSVKELQSQSSPPDWTGSEDQWSSLSPSEKKEFENLRQENQSTRLQVQQLLQTQKDKELKELFPDYDPVEVDRLQKGLIDGSVIATREHLFKVANYEKMAKRVYELGYEDGSKGLSEKANVGQPLPEMTVKPSSDLPEEVKKKGIGAILQYRLAQVKSK